MPTLQLVFAQSKVYTDKVVCVVRICSDSNLPKPENGDPQHAGLSPLGWVGISPSEMIAKAADLGWGGMRTEKDPLMASDYGKRYLFTVFFDSYEPRR